MKSINEIVELLKQEELLIEVDETDGIVENITYSSLEVQKNTLFFCKGAAFKVDYLLQAKQKGASVYVSEIDYQIDLPKIIVNDIRKAMLVVARFYYDNPDQKIKLIGITGTKGKSTTSVFVRAILDEYLNAKKEKPCGLISTISCYDGINEIEPKLTTPEAIVLYKYIYNAVKAGLKYMVIEVSSQALKYYRVNNVEFNIVAFLNIGLDHISPIEHKDFEDYFQSKLKIFSMAPKCVYNLDTKELKRIQKSIKDNDMESIAFSLKDDNADYYGFDIQKGNLFKCKNGGNIEDYKLKVPGDFNVENALAAIAITKSLGVDYKYIKAGLKDAVALGRTMVYESDDHKIISIVDHAHNGLSFKRIFELINKDYKEYYKVAIFGVPGEKSLNRFEDIIDVVAPQSDFIYVVPHDPGKVPFKKIAEKMMERIANFNCPCVAFDNREQAIKDAFNKVDRKTVILATKGVKKYQYINGKHVLVKSDLEASIEAMDEYNKKISK